MAEKKVIVSSNPRLEVKVSNRYSASEKRAIANDIRQYIIERTQRGLGKGAKPWSGKAGQYSEAYVNSVEGRIGGKSKGGPVNLTLSSEMLGSVRESVKGSRIVIDVEEGQRPKAEGNVKGTYGQSSPIKGKARNFLDISSAELKSILANYPLRDSEGSSAERRRRTAEQQDQAQDRAQSVIEMLTGSRDLDADS